MKKLLVVLALVVLLAGCAVARVERVGSSEDGECKAFYLSAFKSFEGVDMTACGASGSAETSTGDGTAEAIVEALGGTYP